MNHNLFKGAKMNFLINLIDRLLQDEHLDCPTCDGDGEVFDKTDAPRDTWVEVALLTIPKCPDCGGTGVVTRARYDQLIQKQGGEN
jgi:DnaJ-class molecular chaperone